MATIRQAAETYKPVETKNISDLNKVSIDLDLTEKTFNQGQADEFSIKVATIEGEDYRVPNSVIKQLNILLDDTPKMTHFKVKKSGTGLNTTYQVLPA